MINKHPIVEILHRWGYFSLIFHTLLDILQIPFMSFYGCSFVGDPFGEIISKAKTKENEIIYADIDLNQVKRARDFMQFFRDRRPETYGDLLKLTIEE